MILEPVSKYGGGAAGQEEVEVDCTYLSATLVWGYLAIVFSEESTGAYMHVSCAHGGAGEGRTASESHLSVCLSSLPLVIT